MLLVVVLSGSLTPAFRPRAEGAVRGPSGLERVVGPHCFPCCNSLVVRCFSSIPVNSRHTRNGAGAPVLSLKRSRGTTTVTVDLS
jgi:hypothetical protein